MAGGSSEFCTQPSERQRGCSTASSKPDCNASGDLVQPVMKEKARFLGLDVHVDTMAVVIAGPDGAVRSLGRAPNHAEFIRKLVKNLGSPEHLRASVPRLARQATFSTGSWPTWESSALGSLRRRCR